MRNRLQSRQIHLSRGPSPSGSSTAKQQSTGDIRCLIPLYSEDLVVLLSLNMLSNLRLALLPNCWAEPQCDNVTNSKGGP
jgi:hypothetical protein